MTQTLKPGMALALRLLADDLDNARAFFANRCDYDLKGGEFVGNPETHRYDEIVRVQAELMRLARSVESPVDPIPSAASTPREAPPEVVASPSRAAGPLTREAKPCACRKGYVGTFSIVGGQLTEDHREDSCSVGGRVVRRPS